MNLNFKIPELSDREFIQGQFDKRPARGCDHCFVNVFLWAKHYNVEFARYKDTLVFKSVYDNHPAYSCPLGPDKEVKEVLDLLINVSKEQGYPFVLYNVREESFEVLEKLYPGKFKIEYNRDSADYLYEREKLDTLSGKKLHGKRNHINKFLSLYNDWAFEKITKDNVSECLEMAKKWRAENSCEGNPEKCAEFCVTLRSLKEMDDLGLVGGLLRVHGEVVAFSIGEKISPDTFDVHIEKALTSIEGAYPMINQQFVRNIIPKDIIYVNREEDLGEAGLRKAKESYRPILMVNKGVAKLC